MFDTIVESVLNEISAEDAYNKFYSNIPRDIFDKYLALYGGKFDAIMKFVLNNVKELENNAVSRKYAVMFLQKYKNAENNVRMAFLKKFKNGEFEDLTDAIQGLNDLEKEGVSTSASIQKDGYVELYNDKRYLLTCTLTYEASQHYYGKSKWCTASDRMGKYDGWYYYLSYVFRNQDVNDEDVYEELGKSIKVCCVLAQFTDKEKNETYQAQVGQNEFYGQICDFEDYSVDETEFLAKFPKFLFDLLNRKIDELLSIEERCFEKEYKYQTERNEFIKNKRKLIEERNRIKRREMQKVLEDEAGQKYNFIKSKFDMMINSNLFSNKDFIKQFVINSYNMKKRFFDTPAPGKEIVEQYEEILKTQGYCYLHRIVDLGDGNYELRIRPIFGHMLRINLDNNNRLIYEDWFSLGRSLYEFEFRGQIVLFVTTNADENINYETAFSYASDDDYTDENAFKDFNANNIFKLVDTEQSIATKSILIMIDFPMYDANNDIGAFRNLRLAQTRKKINGYVKNKLINLNSHLFVDFETPNDFSEIIPVQNFLIFPYYNRLDENFIFIDVNTMSLKGNFVGAYINNSHNCLIFMNPETKELYFSTTEIHDTGLKVENEDEGFYAIMFQSKYIVFNNDMDASFENSCKVYDIIEHKIIINNGAYVQNGPHHSVLDRDTNQSLELITI